jgi:hypothetical protein
MAVQSESERLEALKPDVQKLADWIDRVERMSDDMPTLANAAATDAILTATKQSAAASGHCKSGSTKRPANARKTQPDE